MRKGKSITDGPFAETKDLVGGYTVIQARDLDHAAELCSDCLIFTNVAGSVEIRPLMEMNM